MPLSDFGVGPESGEDAMSKKRNSVPKRIAGVKVPKSVRRGLKDLAASQTGRTVIAEALLAAGAALAATQAKPGSKARKLAAKHKPELQAAVGEAGAVASDAKAAIAARFQEATRTFTEALRSNGHAPPEPAPEAAPPAE
jgi:hypothetical protein